MPDYRRWYQPGGTYFFTVVTYQRWPLFQESSARDGLGKVMRAVGHEIPLETLAIVLLWAHLHCIWTLPRGDCDFSRRRKEIKTRFTRTWLEHHPRERQVARSQAAHGHRGVWQRRYWEHSVRDDSELERCCD